MRRLTLLLLPLTLAAGCAHRADLARTDGDEPTIVDTVTRKYANVHMILGERIIIVDTAGPGVERRVLARLEQLGREPSDVSLIILTHGHFDHAGSAKALARATGAPIVIGRGDVALLEGGHNDSPHAMNGLARLVAAITRDRYPATSPDLVVDDTMDLGPYGIAGQVRVVGGHSPGSLVVELDDGRTFVGDLVRSVRAEPRLHLFHDDCRAAHRALHEVVEARPGATLYPGHGSAFSSDDAAAWLSSDDAVCPD